MDVPTNTGVGAKTSNADDIGLPKVCFAASSGGHLEEILHLGRIRETCPHFFITETAAGMESLVGEKVCALPQLKRTDPAILLLLAKAFVRTARCLHSERPDIVISTGALATIPAMVLGRFFGAKIVYIESQARISSLSLTGKVAGKFADAFFVQWESLLDAAPGSVYKGMLS